MNSLTARLPLMTLWVFTWSSLLHPSVDREDRDVAGLGAARRRESVVEAPDTVMGVHIPRRRPPRSTADTTNKVSATAFRNSVWCEQVAAARVYLWTVGDKTRLTAVPAHLMSRGITNTAGQVVSRGVWSNVNGGHFKCFKNDKYVLTAYYLRKPVTLNGC